MAETQPVEKELICPICADFFTQPKGLPCLHTFCRDCLKAHIMSQTEARFITCPMCRKVIPIPEDKPRYEIVDIFPTNHHVISIMDIVVPHYEPVYCKICKERGLQQKALKYCKICAEDLCIDCGELHKLFNATKSHTLTEITVRKKSKEEENASSKKVKGQTKVDYTLNATFKCNINGKTDKDDEASFFTGVLFLADDRFIVADNTNYKLKLFENDGKFVSDVAQVRPFDLTLINQTTIAATESGSVKFFEVHPNSIKLEKTYNFEWKIFTPHALQISSSLRGLNYCRRQFVGCSGDDKEKHVIVFDSDGLNQRHIWKDETFRENVFKDPWYCKFSEEGDDIFVSDGVGVTGTIKCLSHHGQQKWEYPCEMPRGVTTIGEHLLFTDWKTDEVKVLSKDGEFIKTLLTKDDGIRRPQAIAVNHSRDKLIITNSPPYKSDVILMFDLEYIKSADKNRSSKKQKSDVCAIC